jgi:hypothetical protein
MNLHLAEIAKNVAPGAHAALLVDQAGWHLAGALVVPPNITIVPLPAKCPNSIPRKAHALEPSEGRVPLMPRIGQKA